MQSQNYMPNSLSGFQAWALNFSTAIDADPTTYGLVTLDATELNAAYIAFNTPYQISIIPANRTPVAVANTKENFIASRLVFQAKVAKAQASGLITLESAAVLSITFRKTTKTPIATPTDTPSVDIERVNPQSVTIRAKILGSLTNEIPLNSVGFEVWSLTGAVTPPISPDTFVLQGTATKRFYTQSFDAPDIGEQVYFAIRYITARGLVGPWSNIVGTTVISS